MKGILRSFLFHVLILWVIATYVGGIEYGKQFQILAMGALALTAVDALIKPLINLFLLPFNLITLGTFRWVSGVFTLYLSTLLVPGFSVVPFKYPGFISTMFIIPPIELSLIGAYIAIAILVSICVSLLFWISR